MPINKLINRPNAGYYISQYVDLHYFFQVIFSYAVLVYFPSININREETLKSILYAGKII